MKNFCNILAVIGILYTSQAGAEQLLSISDAEIAGFTKDNQQLFQMIGAKDGWSGTWEGEIVEIYQYTSKSKVMPDVFESSIQEGNISGWVDLCQNENLLMISKGNKACDKLKSL